MEKNSKSQPTCHARADERKRNVSVSPPRSVSPPCSSSASQRLHANAIHDHHECSKLCTEPLTKQYRPHDSKVCKHPSVYTAAWETEPIRTAPSWKSNMHTNYNAIVRTISLGTLEWTEPVCVSKSNCYELCQSITYPYTCLSLSPTSHNPSSKLQSMVKSLSSFKANTLTYSYVFTFIHVLYYSSEEQKQNTSYFWIVFVSHPWEHIDIPVIIEVTWLTAFNWTVMTKVNKDSHDSTQVTEVLEEHKPLLTDNASFFYITMCFLFVQLFILPTLVQHILKLLVYILEPLRFF